MQKACIWEQFSHSQIHAFYFIYLAILTGISMAIIETFIGLYVGRSRFPTFYGVAGSTIILMLWVYFSSVVLLFGAEVTRAYIEHEE